MKHEIGIVGAAVLCASFFFACSPTEPEADSVATDLTTYVAALSVNGDGSDEESSPAPGDEASSEPLMSHGCGFSEIVENVVARFDSDQDGDLDAPEKTALVAEFGDPASGVQAGHPNHGRPTRAAVLLEAYDSDGSGALEAGEIEALQADIQARCEERRSKLLERFDTNGDGALDEAEWAAARDALRERIKERRRERIAEFDTDANGQLDAEERADLRDDVLERRANVEAEFDTDGDGELNDEERAELREHVRACVQTDVPMDTPEAVMEHGRPEGIDEQRPDGNEAEESVDDGSEAADEGASDDGSIDTETSEDDAEASD